VVDEQAGGFDRYAMLSRRFKQRINDGLRLEPGRGSFHLATRTTFSQPAPAQLIQTGEAEAGRLRSMPLPMQWPHFVAGVVTST
jgi:hypothetical protein